MNSVAYNEGYCCGITLKCICDSIQYILCDCVPCRTICFDICSCIYEIGSDCCCYGDYEYCLLCCAGFYNGYMRDDRNTNIVSPPSVSSEVTSN